MVGSRQEGNQALMATGGLSMCHPREDGDPEHGFWIGESNLK